MILKKKLADKQETKEQFPHRSERNRMPPFRDDVITGDLWKQDVVCCRAECIFEDPIQHLKKLYPHPPRDNGKKLSTENIRLS